MISQPNIELDPDLADASDDSEAVAIDAIGKHLMAASPDCIKVLSPDGVVLSMNDAGVKLLEIADTNAIYGRSWSEMWLDGARPRIEAAVVEARAGKTVRFREYCPTAGGQPKWWDVVVSPVRADTGEVQRLLAVSRDITAQKDAERQLRASEQRFRALADNIAQLAWMADKSGALFWYNQRWYDFTGTTFEDMKGWGWKAVHHPEHLNKVVEKFSRHIASGEPWEDVFPLRSAAKEFRWFLSRAMPIRDEHGDVVLWCGTNTDVTDERAYQQRLKQKARLIELSHEAIFVWDLSKGIVSWNRGCEELYGYKAEEAIGQISHRLLDTRFSFSTEEFERRLRADRQWSGHIQHRAKAGHDVWVETRQELIDAGDATLVLETNRDVTEKRKADDMMRLLLSEVVHRVKNTLSIVQAISSQTARRSRSVGSFVTSFNARLQSLSSAHNLLTATSWSGADLRDVIMTQIGEPAGKGFAFRVEGPRVFLPAQNALQLSLILFELASNARKYGALSVPAGRVDITWRLVPEKPGTVEILWRELDGPTVVPPTERGFGAVLIERTGRQPHLSCDLQFPATGVVCQMLVQSDAQHGQSQSAYFDPHQVAAGGAPSASAGCGPVAQRRVLIVEDEPLIAMEIEDILSSAGYAPCGPAATVDAALESIEKHAPDLVVLDGSLFGSPVDRVVQRLEEKRVPFVMVTGFSREILPESVSKLGVRIVRKPIDRKDLLASVSSAVAR